MNVDVAWDVKGPRPKGAVTTMRTASVNERDSDNDNLKDTREHSTKPEVDDLTTYVTPNSQGRAGVRPIIEEAEALPDPEGEAAISYKKPPEEVAEYSGDYNDGADFSTIDNDGKTTAQ